MSGCLYRKRDGRDPLRGVIRHQSQPEGDDAGPLPDRFRSGEAGGCGSGSDRHELWPLDLPPRRPRTIRDLGGAHRAGIPGHDGACAMGVRRDTRAVAGPFDQQRVAGVVQHAERVKIIEVNGNGEGHAAFVRGDGVGVVAQQP